MPLISLKSVLVLLTLSKLVFLDLSFGTYKFVADCVFNWVVAVIADVFLAPRKLPQLTVISSIVSLFWIVFSSVDFLTVLSSLTTTLDLSTTLLLLILVQKFLSSLILVAFSWFFLASNSSNSAFFLISSAFFF